MRTGLSSPLARKLSTIAVRMATPQAVVFELSVLLAADLLIDSEPEGETQPPPQAACP